MFPLLVLCYAIKIYYYKQVKNSLKIYTIKAI